MYDYSPLYGQVLISRHPRLSKLPTSMWRAMPTRVKQPAFQYDLYMYVYIYILIECIHLVIASILRTIRLASVSNGPNAIGNRQ